MFKSINAISPLAEEPNSFEVIITIRNPIPVVKTLDNMVPITFRSINFELKLCDKQYQTISQQTDN